MRKGLSLSSKWFTILKFDEWRDILLHQDENEFYLQLIQFSQKWKKDGYICATMFRDGHRCLTPSEPRGNLHISNYEDGL